MSDLPMHTVPGAYERLQEIYYAGEACMDVDDYEGAIEKFTEGLAIDDNFRQRYITMYAQRAFSYQKLDRLPEAIADYTKALEMERPPQNLAQYYFHRGMCFEELPDDAGENVRRAIADFGDSIALYDGHPGPYRHRGRLLVNEIEDFAAAIPDLEKALSFGESQEARLLLGFARFCLEDFAGARKECEQVDSPYADYLLACIFARLDKPKKLLKHATRATKADKKYRKYLRKDDAVASYDDAAVQALLR